MKSCGCIAYLSVTLSLSVVTLSLSIVIWHFSIVTFHLSDERVKAVVVCRLAFTRQRKILGDAFTPSRHSNVLYVSPLL